MSRRITLSGFLLAFAFLVALSIVPAAAQDHTVNVELGDFYIDMPTTIEAGTITFAMSNVGAMPHTITIEGQGVNVSGDVLSGGQSGSLQVQLAAGTYVVYCPIPGHREAGMELTLTVTGAAEPTATAAVGATPTAGPAATATPLPDLPRTGSGGAQASGNGTLGVLLILAVVATLGAAGTLVYRSTR